MVKKRTFFFRNKQTTLQSGDTAIVDTNTGTISLTRGCEIIYVSSLLNEKDHKIYIEKLQSKRPATVVREITGFNVLEETNGGNSIILRLTSKCIE